MSSRILLPFLFFACLLTACQSNLSSQLKSSLNQSLNEYGVTDYTYVIGNCNNLDWEQNGNSNNLSLNIKEIIANFSLPLLVNQLLDGGVIRSSDTLKNIIPVNCRLIVKDLIGLPANQTRLSLSQTKQINDALYSLAHAKGINAQNDNVLAENDPQDILKHLAYISAQFDSINLRHITPRGAIPIINPLCYTQNLIYYYGWQVFRFQNTTVLWNYFTTKTNALLMLKIPDQNLFLAIQYKQGGIPSPANFNKSDLLQSPLAIGILKAVYMKAQSYSFTRESMDAIKGSPYQFIALKDIIAHARYLDKVSKHDEAIKLYKLYEQLMPNGISVPYLNKNAIASIDYVPDNYNASVPFELSKPTKITVFSAGEVLKPTHQPVWLNALDNVEIYLDIDHNRKDPLSVSNHHRQYRFNYGYPKVSGESERFENVSFAFSDPSYSVYLLEVKIPWKSLNVEHPTLGKTMGFEMCISDCDWDYQIRKSVLALFADSTISWNKPSEYGQLKLSKQSIRTKGKKCYCPQISQAPIIDGIPDKLWDNIAYIPVKNIAEGTVLNGYDLSGKFKAAWNREGIYFLVNVNDNVKSKPGFVKKDNCWIEDAKTNQIVWSVTEKETPDYPTFLSSDTVKLPSGRYKLRYISDNAHSFAGWYSKIPTLDYYGAIIYPFNQ